MPTTHVALRLAAGGSALPRVLSVLHGRGVTVDHLRCDGTELCALLRGATAARVVSVLARVVDVLAVDVTRSCHTRQPSRLPTRHVVWREDLRDAG